MIDLKWYEKKVENLDMQINFEIMLCSIEFCLWVTLDFCNLQVLKFH